ncbi:hypothetical protein ACFL13_03215 [Patescibacteria group bacterium]
MQKPQLQYVITDKGKSVMIGYSPIAATSSPVDPDTFICVPGDNPGLQHMTWEKFVEISDGMPPKFVSEVGETLKGTLKGEPRRKSVSMQRHPGPGKKEFCLAIKITYKVG